jgi:RecA/RadA recombinase
MPIPSLRKSKAGNKKTSKKRPAKRKNKTPLGIGGVEPEFDEGSRRGIAVSPKNPPKATQKKTTKKKTTKKKTVKKSGRKKVPTKKSNLTPIQAWMEKANKNAKYRGSAQIRMASDVKNPYNLRRPTGKLGLDIALGGGLHAGGVVEVQGPQSVGKTLFYWESIAQLQQIYGDSLNVIVAATELRPDKDQARLAGCCIAYSDHEIDELNANRVFRGLPPFTKEDRDDLRKQIGNIVIVMAATAEKLFDVLLDALEENIFQMIVIDSMGALLPKAKDDVDSLQEKTYGGASVPVTDFMNKVYPLLIMDRGDGTMTETTILAINQARARIGGSKYEKTTKEAMGAYAWKHGQLVNILLEKGAKVREYEKGPAVGHSVRWELVKGKAGTHDGKKGSWDYYHFPKMQPVFWRDIETTWWGGVAYYNEHVEAAKDLGVLEGTGWLSFTRPSGEIVKAQGMDNFAQLLAEDQDLFEEVKTACFKKAGVFTRIT